VIKKLASTTGNLNNLFRAIENNKKISIINLGEGEKIQILNEINRPVLFVVSSSEEAHKYYDLFDKLNLTINMCTKLPELLLTDYSPSFNDFTEFVYNLNNPYYMMHIVTVDIMLLSLPLIDSAEKNISVDSEIGMDRLTRDLANLGYVKCHRVSKIGEFSCRGEVLDIVPFSKNGKGYRISFDFDVIEKIRLLDENYIECIEELSSLNLSSNNFFKPDLQLLENTLSKSNNNIKKLVENYQQNNRNFSSLWFLPFENKVTNIYKIINDNFVVAFSDIKQVYEKSNIKIKEVEELLKDANEKHLITDLHKNPLSMNNLIDITNHAVIGFQYLNNSNRIFSPNAVFSFKCLPNINYGENYSSLVLDLKNYYTQGYSVILYLNNDVYKVAISNLSGHVPFNICKSVLDVQKKSINIINKTFENSYNFTEEKLVVIGSNSVGKLYNVKNNKVDKNFQNSFTEFDLPSENDYVVHKIHGIGKCLGIKTLELSKDCKKDYVIVEYVGEDKLYLPIENIDSISKYIGQEEAPKLNKLGSVEFERIKNKAKKEIKDIANNLIAIYKSRQNLKGYVYPKDDDIQEVFENSFPYPLTIDQLNTLNEIKQEMYDGKLIDRLVCGDVGFGKTEVALRIAFKTILAGKNVALLCPTTILSEQHYSTALQRMASFGIKLAVLNRFKTTSEVNKIIDDLNTGKINFIVGTHKLLNKKVNIKNLGLLIIDEEQKFGVEHKEKIKELKQDVNVLTLSATPIPRTLHLSLSGIRDISTIQTPPPNKLNTQVNVLEYNEAVIKMAIDKEIARGGQVLIIYNYVETISSIANIISKITNNQYIIDFAHGQMSTTELENKIVNLYNGKTQILVSTTLIENGVDLPNANTLIILQADKLGLSQLYQLKGRVGRGNRDSFAYLMYQGPLTEIAYKRLKAISEYSAMGSGFKISMKDMELRGAGNIFGNEQHGHMIKIGYAMYISILNNTIAELNNQKVSNDLFTEIKIETDIDTNIPSSISFNTNQKILLYSKISKIADSKTFESVIDSIKDVYGELPKSLENLCKLSFIKHKLIKFNAIKLIVKKSICRIDFGKDVNLEDISSLLSNYTFLDTSNNKTSIVVNGIARENILDYLINLL